MHLNRNSRTQGWSKLRASAVAVAAATTGAGLWTSTARAGVTNFDSAPEGALSTYDGFTWTNVYATAGAPQGAGYAAGVVSPSNVAYNGFGDPASFAQSNGEAFDLNGVYATAAWRDLLQVTFTGFVGSTPVVTQTISPSATSPTFFPLNFSHVTSVAFSSGGGFQHAGYVKDFAHVVLDDLSTSRVFNWQAPVSGSWTDGSKWDLTVAPASDDYAVFDLGAPNSGSVSLNAASAVRTLTTNSGAVVVDIGGNSLTASSIIVGENSGDSGSTTFQNGTLNSSTAVIAASAGTTSQFVAGNGCTWSNSGSVYVGGNALASGGAGTFQVNTGSSATVSGTLKVWTGGQISLAGGGVSAALIDLAGGKISAAANSTLASPLQISGAGGEISCASATLNLNAAVAIDAGAQLTKTGAGTLQINGSLSSGAAAQLTVSAGTLNLNSDGGGNLAITANSTTNFGATQHLASLSVGIGATATLGAGGTKAIVAGVVSVSGASSRLDLKDNKLITHSALGSLSGGSYTGVLGLLAAGRNGGPPGQGNWAGGGIVTSTPQAVAGSFTALGAATASQVKTIGAGATSVWAGQTVTGSDTLVMYTYG